MARKRDTRKVINHLERCLTLTPEQSIKNEIAVLGSQIQQAIKD